MRKTSANWGKPSDLGFVSVFDDCEQIFLSYLRPGSKFTFALNMGKQMYTFLIVLSTKKNFKMHFFVCYFKE